MGVDHTLRHAVHSIQRELEIMQAIQAEICKQLNIDVISITKEVKHKQYQRDRDYF